MLATSIFITVASIIVPHQDLNGQLPPPDQDSVEQEAADLQAIADDASSDEETGVPEVGRFQLAEIDLTLVMIDSVTGKSWILRRTENDQIPAVWVPLPKYENEAALPDLGEEVVVSEPTMPLELRAHQNRITELEAQRDTKELEIRQNMTQFGSGHPLIVQLTRERDVLIEVIRQEREMFRESVNLQILRIQSSLEDLKDQYGQDHPEILRVQRHITFFEQYRDLYLEESTRE